MHPLPLNVFGAVEVVLADTTLEGLNSGRVTDLQSSLQGREMDLRVSRSETDGRHGGCIKSYETPLNNC